MFGIELVGPVTESELNSIIDSPEFNAPFNAYIEDQYQRCTKGLSEAEKRDFDLWRDNKKKQLDCSAETQNAILSFLCAGCC